jgi:hypothetical protein
MGTEYSTISFNILKTPTIKERIIVITVFLLLFANGLWLIVETAPLITFIPSEISARIIGIVYFLFLFWVERFYDGIVRGRITGQGSISLNGLTMIDEEYSFSDIKMLWVNYGMNTVGGGDSKHLFKNFETIKLRVIDSDDKRYNFHIDNHSLNIDGEIVSDYLENLRRKQSFKIHFHETKKFSKKEYENILKRHGIMKSSFRRRKAKGRR